MSSNDFFPIKKKHKDDITSYKYEENDRISPSYSDHHKKIIHDNKSKKNISLQRETAHSIDSFAGRSTLI